jgi:hypothetical protein
LLLQYTLKMQQNLFPAMEPYGYCTVGNQLKEFKQKRERVDYAVAKKLCVGEEISDTFAPIRERHSRGYSRLVHVGGLPPQCSSQLGQAVCSQGRAG